MKLENENMGVLVTKKEQNEKQELQASRDESRQLWSTRSVAGCNACHETPAKTVSRSGGALFIIIMIAVFGLRQKHQIDCACL